MSSDKIQPHRPKIERALLGDILIDESVLENVQSIIEPDSFYRTENKIIYEAILDLKQEGKKIDQVSVVDRALSMHPNHHNPSDIIVRTAEYAGETVSAFNAEHHAIQLRDAHDRRTYLRGLIWAKDRDWET